MTHMAQNALSVQSYLENPCMRAHKCARGKKKKKKKPYGPVRNMQLHTTSH